MKTNLKSIRQHAAKLESAKQYLSSALNAKPNEAMTSLGHVDYKWYQERLAACMAKQGAVDEAVNIQQQLYQAMSERRVNGRGIAEAVLQRIKERRENYSRPELREQARAAHWSCDDFFVAHLARTKTKRAVHCFGLPLLAARLAALLT